MKLIKISNYDFKWFFNIAIHDELKEINGLRPFERTSSYEKSKGVIKPSENLK